MSVEIQAVSAVAAPTGNSGYRALPSSAPDATQTQQPRATGSADPGLPPPINPSPAQQQKQEAKAPQKSATQAEMERMRSAIQELERKLSDARTDLQFKIDDDLQQLIVSVVKATDGSIVRQMPTEVQLRISRLLEQEPGAVIQTMA